jgi:large subunit ribosomal protein L25
MEEILLEAEPRQEIGKNKVNELRRRGFIPAVVYAEGKEALALKVSRHEFLRLIHKHHIENAVLKLKIKDDKKKNPRSCMIKELQHDPVKGDITHIDFNEISLTKVIKINVPVVTKGEPMGVKQEGGSLEHILWEIEIECLPTDIPKNFEVDVSNLKIGDSVHVKDISFPSNIKVLADPEAVVLSVAAPMKEEVVPAAEGEEKPELEVIKEKKEESALGTEAEDKEKEKKEKK